VAVWLPGKEGAGAAHAGLSLVADQDQILLVAPLPQPVYERLAGRKDAALALHRLDQDAGRLRGRRRLDRRQVVERHLPEAVGQRQPRVLVLLLAGGGGSGERAAVERALEANDPVGPVTVRPAVLARQLDRALVGLGAAVGKE